MGGSPAQVRIATRCLKGESPHVLSMTRECIRDDASGQELIARNDVTQSC